MSKGLYKSPFTKFYFTLEGSRTEKNVGSQTGNQTKLIWKYTLMSFYYLYTITKTIPTEHHKSYLQF